MRLGKVLCIPTLQRGRDQLIAELPLDLLEQPDNGGASTGPRSIDRGAMGA